MTIGKRLSEIRETLGLYQKDMAKIVGGHVKSWENYEKDISVPGGEVLSKLSLYGIDINWLLTGVNGGKPLETSLINIYGAEISAGAGSLVNHENIIDRYSLPNRFFLNYGLNKNNSIGVSIKGDSMEPKFFSGDIAIIDTSINFFENDGIYAFCYGDYCFIKHLQFIGTKLYAVSTNKAYEKWEIEKDTNFKIIGMVKVAICRV